MEKKIFLVNIILNQRHYVAEPFWTPGPPSEQACLRSTRQCYILNFKHLSQEVLKKIFEYFSMYFYGSNLGHPGIGAILESGALI